MDENNTNVELEEESLEMVDESASKMTDDELTKAIQEQMEKLRRQSMLIGAQAMCQVVLQKILAVTNKPGKISMRAYERLINGKEISHLNQNTLGGKSKTAVSYLSKFEDSP